MSVPARIKVSHTSKHRDWCILWLESLCIHPSHPSEPSLSFSPHNSLDVSSSQHWAQSETLLKGYFIIIILQKIYYCCPSMSLCLLLSFKSGVGCWLGLKYFLTIEAKYDLHNMIDISSITLTEFHFNLIVCKVLMKQRNYVALLVIISNKLPIFDWK